MPGNCRVSFRLTRWLSAHHCAAITSDRRCELSISAPAARRPAASVMATTATATSTSTSVKPRAERRHGAGLVADHGEGPEAVGGQLQALVAEAQHDALRADQRLRARAARPARPRPRHAPAASSQRVGRAIGCSACPTPMKRKCASPSASRRHPVHGQPEARDSARADSSRALSRCGFGLKPDARRVAQRQADHAGRHGDQRDHDHQLDQREAAAGTRATPRRTRQPARGARRGGYCQEPMSALLPSPPAVPSAPKLNTSISPFTPGFTYW